MYFLERKSLILPINKNEITQEMIAKAMLITARKILVCHLSSVNQAEFALICLFRQQSTDLNTNLSQ
jgi:hypothetical protein